MADTPDNRILRAAAGLPPHLRALAIHAVTEGSPDIDPLISGFADALSDVLSADDRRRLENMLHLAPFRVSTEQRNEMLFNAALEASPPGETLYRAAGLLIVEVKQYGDIPAAERRGLWLPGRSAALNFIHYARQCMRVEQGFPTTRRQYINILEAGGWDQVSAAA